MSIPGNANPLLLASAAADAAAAGPIKSVRFNNDDSAYLNRTPSSAGNRKTFTISFWFKTSVATAAQHLFFAGTAIDQNLRIRLNNNDMRVQIYNPNLDANLKIANLFRDPSAWYHLVLSVDTTASTASDRMKAYINGVEAEYNSPTYPTLDSSTLVNNTNHHYIGAQHYGSPSDFFDGYMADFYLIDGSALTPTSFGAFDDSGVWQAAAYSGTFGTNGFHLLDFANEATIGHDSSGNNNDFTANNFATGSNPIYSDNLTTNSGTSWFGGAAVNAFDGATNTFVQGALGQDVTFTPGTAIPVSTSLKIWADSGSGFGVGNGPYQIIYNGSTVYNSSMWSSPFTITAAAGTSLSSLVIDTTPSGEAMRLFAIEVDGTILVNGAGAGEDVLFDVPTNGTQSDTGAGGEVSGNYCVMNPLDSASGVTLSNGNLEYSAANSSDTSRATIGVSSGKWYWEVTITNQQNGQIGIADASHSLTSYVGFTDTSFSFHIGNGQAYTNGSGASLSGFSATSEGDIIGVALDLDSSTTTLAFYKNGSLMGTAFSGISGTFFPALSRTGGTGAEYTVNFGQRAFRYQNAGTNRPAATYKALCTTNLPTPTIADGSDYFDGVTYTGNGTTAHSITGLSLASAPDLVWIKQRNATRDHVLQDIIRGTGVFLSSNTTAADQSNGGTGSSSLGIQSFDSNGFTLGTGTGVNTSSGSYVAWCWDAGSSTVSNTDGDLTSSVRANQSAGFSIVKFTAGGSYGMRSIGHALNAKPSIVISKRIDSAGDWLVHTDVTGSILQLELNKTDAGVAASSYYSANSSTFSLYHGHYMDNGWEFINYCFAPVAGYSAFGSYEGNGSSTVGPFISTGFRVNYLLVKNVDTASPWFIFDAVRDPENTNGKILRANDTTAEFDGGTEYIDFLSNGFKLRTDIDPFNKNGDTYIYWAIAENPFQANGGLAR